jgi:hypothetical protein
MEKKTATSLKLEVTENITITTVTCVGYWGVCGFESYEQFL